jgi:hypothetical protein
MELEKLNCKQLGAQQKTKEVTDAAVKVVVYYIQSSKSHNHPHRQANLGHHTDQDKYHGLLRFSSSSTTCAMKETCKMYKVHASTSYEVPELCHAHITHHTLSLSLSPGPLARAPLCVRYCSNKQQKQQRTGNKHTQRDGP